MVVSRAASAVASSRCDVCTLAGGRVSVASDTALRSADNYN